MLIEVNSHLKLFVSYWLTRSSILRTSSFSEATMNVPVSTESMAFMMNARDVTTSNFGKLLLIVSTVYQLLLLLMKKFFVCMEVFPQNFQTWSKSEESWDQQMCLTQVFFAIYSGLILKRTFKGGRRMTEESLSSSVLTLSVSSSRNMTLTSSAEHIKW